MAESTITRMWFKKGSRPKVKSYAGRKSISYSGFVNPKTGELIVSKPDWFNFNTTINSIRDFISKVKDKKQHIFIVLDNAPWHKKAKRLIEENLEYEDIKSRATLVSLPPYSPDLNPIEQVWRVTRREKTHNRFWPKVEVLQDCLDNWFKQFSVPNQKLQTLCSFH